MESRKSEEAALRRYEAAGWLRKMVGIVATKDLPAEPSEEEFRLGLRSGIILCNVISKVQLVVVLAVQEIGIPIFEASDLEQGEKSSRIGNGVLALKSYSEWKQTGANDVWKFGGTSNACCFNEATEKARKAAAYNNKSSSTNIQSSKKPTENPKAVAKFEWRAKVNSPVVEDAIDHFTRHLVSEWVTGLWYSRLTPDKEAPEELVQLIIGVLGEISGRMRNINLIDFLIRDLVNLVCTHLELFRASISKIEKTTHRFINN
ncbi:hypothetical protein KIW84_014112 [Lathyrus oleraceus]|uniref:PXA domain-containing protein n=1 Tax=Pisum sativum TaxID=3888 RepID=A0A9D5GYZ8_PEA|nr:hypothetical protein KIW84_014112 [Pisum sativum]